eukprot:4994776-Prymnesium_polylepis.1
MAATAIDSGMRDALFTRALPSTGAKGRYASKHAAFSSSVNNSVVMLCFSATRTESPIERRRRRDMNAPVDPVCGREEAR